MPNGEIRYYYLSEGVIIIKRRSLLIICLTLLIIGLGLKIFDGQRLTYPTPAEHSTQSSPYTPTEQVSMGIVNGIPLGTTFDKVHTILGKPDKHSDNCILLYDGLAYIFSPKDKKLILIGTNSKDQVICGINPGMAFSQAEKILGTPSEEKSGVDTWLELFTHGGNGGNTLILQAKSPQGPIESVALGYSFEKEKIVYGP